MKLPIRRIPGTIPPRFEYFQVINLPGGGTQAIRHEGCVPSSMESSLCDLLAIAQQLAEHNETLRSMKVK